MFRTSAKFGTPTGHRGPGRTLANAVLFMVLVLLTALAGPEPSRAASTTLQVTARVLPWLKVSATPLIQTYQVSREDIDRGYVDLPRSLSIHLRSNLQQDIHLDLTSFGPGRIEVLSAEASGSGALRIAAIGNNIPVSRELDLRLLLPSGMTAGTYPFRVHVSAVDI